VTHLIFQEEKPVGERGADRTPAKKYVSSVILAPIQQTFLTIHGYLEVVGIFRNFFRNFAVLKRCIPVLSVYEILLRWFHSMQ